MSYKVEFPDITEAAAGMANKLGTDELPLEAVNHRTALWIWDHAPDPAHPRISHFSMAFTLDDKANPSVTPAQAKYVLRLIEHAAKTWRARHEIIE